jgi:nicotinamide-nucleotide amidase
MQAEIISIGDELLIGQTINTNAAWIGAELSKLGIQVNWCVTLSDTKEAILEAIDTAIKRSKLIVVTGGLGPTKDDITKHTLCEYFDTELEMNPSVLERIETFFKHRNRPMLEVNTLQAALPKACTVIPNLHGTASGMWFEKKGAVLISLPGVPYEMKGMMHDSILEKIQQHFNVSAMHHKTILTTGIGESFLADALIDWENRIRALGLGLAYLPSPGMVKLRITSYKGLEDDALIEEFFEELHKRFQEQVFGRETETLQEVIGKLLKNSNHTLGTVESCTGGGIAQAITSIAGASDYFLGSLVTYSNQLKINLADVSAQTIDLIGVVSEATVREMAEGGLKKLGVDYCLSLIHI